MVAMELWTYDVMLLIFVSPWDIHIRHCVCVNVTKCERQCGVCVCELLKPKVTKTNTLILSVVPFLFIEQHVINTSTLLMAPPQREWEIKGP